MKILSAALAATGALALALAGAAPAMAAGRDIDSGDSMYTISCDQDYNDWQLFSVAPATAFSTKIGDGGGTSEFGGCAGQPAYNAHNGKSYYIQITFDGDVSHWTLAEIDLTTGVSSVIDEFVWDNEGPQPVRIDAIAIAPDGTAYALGNGALYTLDLDTAAVEPVDECVSAFAFASDPVTGEFYAVDRDGQVYQFDDISEGCAVTMVGQLTHADLDLEDIAPEEDLRGVFALQIDGGGTFWIDVATREGLTQLWSFTPTTLSAPVLSGLFTDEPFYTSALLIIPGAALAATGADLSLAPYLAGGAVLAVLAGGAVLLIRRRTA